MRSALHKNPMKLISLLCHYTALFFFSFKQKYNKEISVGNKEQEFMFLYIILKVISQIMHISVHSPCPVISYILTILRNTIQTVQ